MDAWVHRHETGTSPAREHVTGNRGHVTADQHTPAAGRALGATGDNVPCLMPTHNSAETEAKVTRVEGPPSQLLSSPPPTQEKIC